MVSKYFKVAAKNNLLLDLLYIYITWYNGITNAAKYNVLFGFPLLYITSYIGLTIAAKNNILLDLYLYITW